MIAPDQTAHYSDTSIGTTIQGVQLIDGVLEGGPFRFNANRYEARFTMDLHSGYIRLEVQEDNTFSVFFQLQKAYRKYWKNCIKQMPLMKWRMWIPCLE